MPPRNRRKNDSKGSQESRHSICLLLDLPLPALAQIYQSCNQLATRKALLAVSRGCRDLVLREARGIQLTPHCSTAAERKPVARLLNRACNLTAHRLELWLDLRLAGHPQSRKRLLADLLEPGIQQSGWASVATLVLYVRKATLQSYAGEYD
jgi:hypothetical protein